MKLDESTIRRIGEQFGSQIAELISSNAAHTVTVQDVSDDYASVSVFDGDTPSKVPLQLLHVGDAMLRVVPTKGTTAVVTNVNGTSETMVFLAYTSVDVVEFKRGSINITLSVNDDNESDDSLMIKVGDSSLRVTGDVVEFNGGENDGLPLSKKVVDRLNSIERDINKLKSLMVGWTPLAQDGGASLKTTLSLAGWLDSSLNVTTVSDIANNKITQ